MLNFYTASDAIAEESFAEGCKSRIAGRATEGKLMGFRSAASRFTGSKRPKRVYVGRVEDIESVMAVRDRRDFTEMSDFAAFMGEERRIPSESIVGEKAAEVTYKTAAEQRDPLPTVRVFKAFHGMKPKPGQTHKYFEYLRYCD